MKLYADLLGEAKVRISAIEAILNRQLVLPSPIAHEFCFLQLRFLCEIIALGCLVLHGDIKAEASAKALREGKIKKAWSAQLIIEELSKLHPSFYPFPTTQLKLPGGPNFHLTPLKPDDYLSKDDLVRLWNHCGDHLHRGSLKKLLKARMPTQFNFPDVSGWLTKIGALLSFHVVPLFEPGTLLLCILRNRDDNEAVQVAFAAANPPPEGYDASGAITESKT
jgi:hypothetical protein